MKIKLSPFQKQFLKICLEEFKSNYFKVKKIQDKATRHFVSDYIDLYFQDIKELDIEVSQLQTSAGIFKNAFEMIVKNDGLQIDYNSFRDNVDAIRADIIFKSAGNYVFYIYCPKKSTIVMEELPS